MALGVVVVGLYNVSEKTATWDADYYLYERWTPTPGFYPHTEVVNEVVRHSEQFDSVDLRDDDCVRTRRIYSTLHNDYNLRRFPFDRQHLQLVFSDADYDSKQVIYENRPQTLGIAEDAVYGNALTRRRQRERVLTLDRRGRWLFPLLTGGAILLAVIWSMKKG